MYDARVIANEVLIEAWSAGYEMTQIDIQKICYFMHGHHLIDHNEPLIASSFEAWKHGPVQRSLYDSFKKFGDQAITELATGFDPIRRKEKELPRLSSNSAKSTISRHLSKYLGIPSFDLVEITHEKNTPWTRTRLESDTSANVGMRISNKMIAEHFEGL